MECGAEEVTPAALLLLVLQQCVFELSGAWRRHST
jgi:hypothetical protein